MIVNIFGGKYFVDDTIKFTDEDSGETAPVIYKAYEDEKVELIGGKSIPISAFVSASEDERVSENVKDKVLKVDMSQYGINKLSNLQPVGYAPEFWKEKASLLGYTGITEEEVFADGYDLKMARYPNEGYSTIKSVETASLLQNIQTTDYSSLHGHTIGVDSDVAQRLSRWQNADDPWIYGHWQYSWLASSTPIANIDSAKAKIQLKYPSTSDYFNSSGIFYVYNLLEELDVPGEYYIDRKNKELFIYPTDDMKEVYISLLDKPVIELNRTKNVIFKNIDVKGTRSNGIDVTFCKNIVIDSCNIGNIGGTAISSNGSSKCIYKNNNIYNTAKGGISVHADDFVNLYPTDCLVDNNTITNFSRTNDITAAISMAGIGDTYSHNVISGSEGSAVSMGSSDSVFEYNDISNVLTMSSDMGAIYAYHAMHKRGNIIRNNYFHDCSSNTPFTHSQVTVMAVYLDENTSGVEISQNLFVNFDGDAVFINAGRDNTVKNNIAYNVPIFCRITNNTGNMSLADFKAEHYELEAFSGNPKYSKYPHFANILSDNPMLPKYNVIEKNAVCNVDTDFAWVGATSYEISRLERNNSIDSSVSVQEPGFVDSKNGNYSLKSDSPLFTLIQGFEAPEFKKMGLK